MDSDRHRRLCEFIQSRVGNSLRGLVWYGESDWEAIYIREDLATQELRADLADICERARSARALFPEADYPPLGETTATTEVHENGVVLHLPESPDSGTLVSLDRDVARHLTSFVVDCSEILEPAAKGATRPDSSAE